MRSKSVLGLSSVVLILEPLDGSDGQRGRSCRSGWRAHSAAAGGRARAGHAVAAVVAQPGDEDRRQSETLSQVELTTLIRWTMRPRLMAVPGVANVAIWGQRDGSSRCWSIPIACAHNVTLDEVVQAARDGVALDSRRLPRHAEPAARRRARGRGPLRERSREHRRSPGHGRRRLRLGDVATIVGRTSGADRRRRHQRRARAAC